MQVVFCFRDSVIAWIVRREIDSYGVEEVLQV
jgi:hypothetical protein